MKSPAIRSYRQAARTLLPTSFGDTTTIGAIFERSQLLSTRSRDESDDVA